MKNILVPVDQHASAHPTLEAAFSLAAKFGSFVEGLALGPEIPDYVAYEFPITLPILDEKAQQGIVERSRRIFEDFTRSLPASGEAGAVSYAFAGDQLYTDRQIGSYGRLFDLILVARPDGRGERQGTVESALFDSGRPVLLVPPVLPAGIAQNVVIAWNGSTETARSVAVAMPLLLRAGRVTVLSVEGWGVDEGPAGADLARFLQRHGIAAEPVSLGMNRSAGESILRHAHALGADLLIKGAYTQSRLRQMIFGGATSHIMRRAELPVLLAH